MTIRVLHAQGRPHAETARLLGVSEGTVRYHLKRAADGAVDGRKKAHAIEELGLQAVVQDWWATHAADAGSERPPNVEALFACLRDDHCYKQSYKSVLRYVRAAFPAPKLRPFRRVETPPGAQTQSDWVEVPVDVGDAEGPAKLYGFVMRLSHSRMKAVVWSRRKDQLAWLHCHNEAFKRLGGVAAINRIDNEKTAVTRGAGPWGELNAVYRAYARSLKFHVDACEPRCPEQKGKVERGAADVKALALEGRCFLSLGHLQEYTDAKVDAEARRRICSATGKTVQDSWAAEKLFLTALPATMPEPFDLVKDCPVYKDCTVRFEGRTYAVPFAYAYMRVEVRGCSDSVQAVDRKTGALLVKYPRGTAQRLLIDPCCYEGKATDYVEAPKPLGRLSRKLMELAAQPIQRRSLDLYAQLAEVAR